MNVAVRIRRAIVKDKAGPVFTPVLYLVVEIDLIPFMDDLRFLLSELCLHGKGCFWQIESVFDLITVLHHSPQLGPFIVLL